ncbi:MAG: hypothetical protein JXR20_04610 [Balneola sp.]
MNKEIEFTQFTYLIIELSDKGNHRNFINTFINDKMNLLQSLQADTIIPNAKEGTIKGIFKRTQSGVLLNENDYSYVNYSFEDNLEDLAKYQFEKVFFNSFSKLDKETKINFANECLPMLKHAVKKISKEDYFKNFPIFSDLAKKLTARVSSLNPKSTENSGRPQEYDKENTKIWWIELSKNPEYRQNGKPVINKITQEIIIRHNKETGQKPSVDTIKDHRRKLGLMGNKG